MIDDLDAVLAGTASAVQRREIADRCAREAHSARSPAMTIMANQALAFPLGIALALMGIAYFLIVTAIGYGPTRHLQ